MPIIKNGYVFTPRFCRVRIAEIFDSVEDARAAGFTEQTYYDDPEGKFVVLGKSKDMYHMTFAAAMVED